MTTQTLSDIRLTTIDSTSSSLLGPRTNILYTIPFWISLAMTPKNRGQAKTSCKPASSYGWDWHPRLVPSGIWRDAYLEILPKSAPYALEASYRLNDELTQVNISSTVKTHGAACVHASLITPQGDEACGKDITVGKSGEAEFELCFDSPELWYPRGYGEQSIYTLRVSGAGEVFERKLGFRRSKLVKNEDRQTFEKSFPMGPIGALMTIEINGKLFLLADSKGGQVESNDFSEFMK